MAFELLSDGLVVAQRGQVLKGNAAAAQILGVPQGELTGLHSRSSFLDPQGRRGRARDPLVGAREVIGFAWVYAGQDADGQQMQVEVSSMMVPGTHLVIHQLRDVTEERAAEARQRRVSRMLADERDRAEAKDQAKQRFLAGLAHELRTPLASMRGYLEIIEEEGPGGRSPSGRCEILAVRAATEQVLEVVEKVHDQAMLESGRVSLYLVPVDVAEMVHEVLETVRPLVGPEVQLQSKVEPGVWLCARTCVGSGRSS